MMTPGTYVSHEAMHVLAEALDEVAAAAELDGPQILSQAAAQPGAPAAARARTEGDGGAPDDLHALLDFVWSRTAEEISGLVSLQGDAAQREAESYLADHGAELLRWERQALVVTQLIVVKVREERS